MGRKYAWLTMVILVVSGMGLSILVSLRASERAIQSAQQDGARQQAATLAAVCALVVAQDNVYRGTAPSTPAGRDAAEAWHHLRELFQCDRER